MQIKLAEISNIKPYENNPRKLSEQAIEKVAMSLKEYGFRQPIVVDKDMVIVAGHTRFRASKKLGLKQVPISIIDNLSEEQINAYRIADNRTAEESEWDNELLKMEIKELEAKDFKLDLLGFNDEQLNNILFEEKQGLTDEDEVPEAPEDPISKLGDIWKLGNHRLMCGDSTKEDDVKKLINNNKIDLIYTDPPYGINEKGANALLHSWDKEFAQDEESQRILDTIYNWEHNGYGCNDPIMDKHCDSICKFYRSKDYGIEVFNADLMSNDFQEFVQVNFENKSLDLNDMYDIGGSYKFTVGELITMIGDTKLGKTAFIKNLVARANNFK